MSQILILDLTSSLILTSIQIFTALQIKSSKQREVRSRFKPFKKFVLSQREGEESNIGGGILASSKIGQLDCLGS